MEATGGGSGSDFAALHRQKLFGRAASRFCFAKVQDITTLRHVWWLFLGGLIKARLDDIPSLLSPAMNIAQPVTSEVESVEFTFLSAREIKAISVKRIENESTFDNLLNPVPGGLYDPALGSWGDAP